jgi:release factor glutamine methyltransferase
MKPSPQQDARSAGEMSSPRQHSVRGALREGIARLRDAKVPSFTLAAELLLLHATGRDRTWIYAHPEEAVNEEDARRFFALIERRAAGEPTQHLTGKQEFWGLEFEVTRDVLIPRPETEHVIEVALDRLALQGVRAGRPNKSDGAGLRIADIGTGSGCIAIPLAKELPGAQFVATDISVAALEIARRNAARHGVADRVSFLTCSLLEGCSVGARYIVPLQHNPAPAEHHGERPAGRCERNFDLIASNPPYIGRREAATLAREVRDHEPALALYGGEEGYELYGELIRQSAQHLKPGGILVLELGHNSLPAVKPLFDPAHWTNVGVTDDLAGIPRVIAAEHAAGGDAAQGEALAKIGAEE